MGSEEHAQGRAYRVQIADFGYSAYSLQDDDLVELPHSPGWEHPDGHPHGCPRHVAKKRDVYSLGVMSLWLFFQKHDEYPTVEQLVTAMKNQSLPSLAERLLQASSYHPSQTGVLHQIFQDTLVHGHDERATVMEVLSHLSSHSVFHENPPPSVDRDFSPHEFTASFQASTILEYQISMMLTWSAQIAPAAYVLSYMDYRLRQSIVESFQELLHSTSNHTEFGRNATLQLALCYKLGFGVPQDGKKSDELLEHGCHDSDALYGQLAVLETGSLMFNSDFDPIWSGGLARAVDIADVYRKRPFSTGQPPLEMECRQHLRELRDVASFLGEIHVLTTNLRITLACLLYDKGDLTGCRNLLQEALDHTNKMEGDVSEIKMDLCRAYAGLGEFEQAVPLAQEVHSAYGEHLGLNHPMTIDSMALLANCHLESGDRKAALSEAN